MFKPASNFKVQHLATCSAGDLILFANARLGITWPVPNNPNGTVLVLELSKPRIIPHKVDTSGFLTPNPLFDDRICLLGDFEIEPDLANSDFIEDNSPAIVPGELLVGESGNWSLAYDQTQNTNRYYDLVSNRRHDAKRTTHLRLRSWSLRTLDGRDRYSFP
jgi:hypothetical protein